MPILLFLLITALDTEFYIFLLYTFLLFSPPTLETAQGLRTALIFRGAHQAKASSSQAHQATQVLHTLSIKRGVHQAEASFGNYT